MRLLWVWAVVAILLAAVSVAQARAFAGPRYILVHGGDLPGQVLLDDEAGNELLVSAPDLLPRSFVPREADRPVYELALFFMVPDLNGRDPSSLRPEETSATGRFFPAVGELEAIFELGAAGGIGPRRDAGLTPTMLDYLVASGVPVVSDAVLGPEEPTPTPEPLDLAPPPDEGGDGMSWVYWILGGGAIVALGGFAIFRARRPRRAKSRGIHF